MTKNIEWLKEEIEEDIKSWGGGNPDYFRGASDAYENVKDWLNQLDEPEVLSQEWISENVEYAYFDMLDGSGRLSSATAIIKPKKLQNLLVPKQELPVIPDYVAEWIDTNKEKYDLVQLFWEIGEGGLVNLDVDRWIEENPNAFARAWLGGYTVEEEQKYYVKDEKGNTLLRKVIKGFGIDDRKGKIVSSTKAGEASDARLTEQEIKDYDPRYWAFRKPVEEVD